jgi:hypothetical protein
LIKGEISVNYQNELLANAKVQEIEASSREAWKFHSIKKESMLQSVFQRVADSLNFKKSKTDNSNCVTC